MTKLKTLVASLGLFVFMGLAGCQTVTNLADGVASNELLVQYSTMKLIEQSDDITSEGVVEAVEKARTAMDEDQVVSIDELKARVADKIDFESFAPSDRLLIAAVVDEVQKTLEAEYKTDLVSEEVEYKIGLFLDNVELAARLSGE